MHFRHLLRKRSIVLYRVVVMSLEAGDLVWVSVSVVALCWMPVDALPLGCGAYIGSDGSGRVPSGCLIQPALWGAHHP